jgi:putative endonuclease
MASSRPSNRAEPRLSPTQVVGAAGEQKALEYLLTQGCRLVASNQRGKVGELDLVMHDGSELVFVEVRVRASRAFGGAAASIGAAKQARLRRAAQLYLLRQFGPSRWPACRFDVVALDADQLNWIKNAF